MRNLFFLLLENGGVLPVAKVIQNREISTGATCLTSLPKDAVIRLIKFYGPTGCQKAEDIKDVLLKFQIGVARESAF